VELINRYGIKFVLDIHGAAASRPFDIAIGKNHDETDWIGYTDRVQV
jgi:hypothetical protein